MSKQYDFYKAYLSKLVEEGILESDEVEKLTEEELVKIATDFMNRADAALDAQREGNGN